MVRLPVSQLQVLDMVGMQCIAHHNFEPRMQPMGPGYQPVHPMHHESVIAGYPVMPVMGLPY